MEEINNEVLPRDVQVIVANNAVVYLVGISHYSQGSQENVLQVINLVKPDYVVLDLCHNRINLLTLGHLTASATHNTSGDTLESFARSIWVMGLTRGIFYQVIMRISANITRNIGTISGKEFRIAVNEAKRVNSKMYYGSRPIDITVKRMMATLSWFNSIRLLSRMLFTKFGIDKNDVEQLKKRDLLGSAMDQLVSDYPELQKVIVDERIQFFTHRLQRCARIGIHRLDSSTFAIPQRPPIIVAVVEMSKVDGIMSCWQKISIKQIKDLTRLPKQSVTDQFLQLVFKASFIGILIWGYTKYEHLNLWPSIICNVLTRVKGKIY